MEKLELRFDKNFLKNLKKKRNFLNVKIIYLKSIKDKENIKSLKETMEN